MKEVHDILNSTLLKNSLKLKVVKDNLETKVGVGCCSSVSKQLLLSDTQRQRIRHDFAVHRAATATEL